MRITWRTEIPNLLILAVIAATSAWAWTTLPDRIPVHWNLAGEADRYGTKGGTLFILPAVALATYLLLVFLPRIDPGRANYARFAGSYTVLRTAVLALQLGIYSVVLLATAGAQVDGALLVSLGMGALFLVLGNVMGKLRPNWFVGIRTPWTLSSATSSAGASSAS
jgi:uncharacterized membrane protein